MRILYKTAAYLMVLLGIAHIALTPVFFQRFGLDVLWFAGTGLGFIFLGNLNLIVLINKKGAYYMMAITSNIMALLLTILILSINAAPQSYAGLVIALLLAIASVNEYIRLLKKMVREASKPAGEDDQQDSGGREEAG